LILNFFEQEQYGMASRESRCHVACETDSPGCRHSLKEGELTKNSLGSQIRYEIKAGIFF
jgi:hypothetical protein